MAARLDANATLSDNHFVNYVEHYGTTAADDVHYDGKTLGFFPATLGNLAGDLTWNGARLGADARFLGRIYVDNNESRAASIAAHGILDLRAGYERHVGGTRVGLTLRVFNALDRRYATSGYMDYDALGALVPQYVPAATRNVLVEVRIGR